MNRIRRALFAIGDPQRVSAGVLRKVAALVRASGARLELFHALDESLPVAFAPGDLGSPSSLLGSQQLADNVRQRLERIARGPSLRGCQVAIEVQWRRPPHEAIVREALKIRADLVIATTHARGRAVRLLLRNTDWELIRNCPCPVLLIKSARVHRKATVLVAVDPFHAHAKPASLDERLLTSGKHIGALLGEPVHAFHAYMPLIPWQGSFGDPVVWEDPEVERTHGAEVRAKFNRLADMAGIPRARRHLVVGDVPTQLCAVAARLRSDVVVMGAVSRSGLRRLFIGSTAERVLDELPCDVLIVKPRNFPARLPGG